ncbi:AIPR family protein [Azospirillum sp. SYSU D00513]|uniref:AIPR family protein n=1 Tax=Azospirillum sp. SYSU D00513 TaxID=2812561 RepID=UPI001A95ACD3|nr:AIPR family protein [Azospirillum sp. SYSU D00513]
MDKFKNSILKQNPRSYLEFAGQKVNGAIRSTILSTKTNEFALLNNGITLISDETRINEKIGEKNRAKLHVKNPQIINGGQTAYTLSKLYREIGEANAADVFRDKEVLLKIITLSDEAQEKTGAAERLELIEQISTATNQQTAVTNADRMSGERYHIELQMALFKKYGILYERKRGEFGDGISDGYITANQVIERNIALRIYLAANGDIESSMKKQVFAKFTSTEDIVFNSVSLDRFYFAYRCFKKMTKKNDQDKRRLRYQMGRIYAITESLHEEGYAEISHEFLNDVILAFEQEWNLFLEHRSNIKGKYVKFVTEASTGEKVLAVNEEAWAASQDFLQSVVSYFSNKKGLASVLASTGD